MWMNSPHWLLVPQMITKQESSGRLWASDQAQQRQDGVAVPWGPAVLEPGPMGPTYAHPISLVLGHADPHTSAP